MRGMNPHEWLFIQDKHENNKILNNEVSHEVNFYQQTLWRLLRVFHVGQRKCLALCPELSGRYSTTLHCAQSTLLWAQACGLDLGEWAHPIYIQAISNHSQRHMHIHNRIDAPSRCLSPLLSQPAVLITQLRQVKERKVETERLETQGRSTPKPPCSLHANSRRVSDPGTSKWCSLTRFLLLSAREVWWESPLDSRPPNPTTICACSCWVKTVLVHTGIWIHNMYYKRKKVKRWAEGGGQFTLILDL